jgi:small subunit ribosomal protein S6
MGGEVTNHDDWGKRALAYEIEHHREGFYHFYKFNGGGPIVSELNRQLRIDENVLRHLIVKDDVKPLPIQNVGEEPRSPKPEENRGEES